jgi:hypothetical protein
MGNAIVGHVALSSVVGFQLSGFQPFALTLQTSEAHGGSRSSRRPYRRAKHGRRAPARTVPQCGRRSPSGDRAGSGGSLPPRHSVALWFLPYGRIARDSLCVTPARGNRGLSHATSSLCGSYRTVGSVETPSRSPSDKPGRASPAGDCPSVATTVGRSAMAGKLLMALIASSFGRTLRSARRTPTARRDGVATLHAVISERPVLPC